MSGALAVLGVDGDGPAEQTAGGGRGRQPYPGHGPACGPSGDRGAGARLCPAVSDRWPQGLRHGPADPLWSVDAPRTAPGERPHAQAAVDTIARAALRASGEIVPAPAPRRRHTPRRVRHPIGHRTDLGAMWLDDQYRVGSLVIPGIHNSMIFRANKECPYKSSWIL